MWPVRSRRADTRTGNDAPSRRAPLTGELVFVCCPSGPFEVDCLLSSPRACDAVPVHLRLAPPGSGALARVELSLLRHWLSEDEPVQVSLVWRTAGPRVLLSHGRTRLRLDLLGEP